MNDPIDTNSSTWSVSYGDHSGNGYRFWKSAEDECARFAYDPVTPERSSSGTYSGGDPKKGTLDPGETDALLTWIRDLEAAIQSHSEHRMMGTGSFRVRAGDSDMRRFIVRNGQRLRDFNAFLEPYRKP